MVLTLVEAALVAFIAIDCHWDKALSLLLVIILRGMIYTHKADYGIEDEYDTRGRTWEPLLNQQTSQASGSTKGDGRVTHSNIWSSRIGDKVFLLCNIFNPQSCTLIPYKHAFLSLLDYAI
ncbi:hypothetical protein RchiOBHm_Chr1g0339871 [Rosa chinensis]|uniref:Uncharacterized protein n=1 Tax=Rosa chinensis TaxID=74649 RepID=A0A2P6SDA7_ROSCH|nr:hypothetical protein RchiOBHm_Chr1g0339871 [Rosa chinensis]